MPPNLSRQAWFGFPTESNPSIFPFIRPVLGSGSRFGIVLFEHQAIVVGSFGHQALYVELLAVSMEAELLGGKNEPIFLRVEG